MTAADEGKENKAKPRESNRTKWLREKKIAGLETLALMIFQKLASCEKESERDLDPPLFSHSSAKQ